MRKAGSAMVAEIGPMRVERATFELPGGQVKVVGIVHRPQAVGVLPLRRTAGGEVEVLLVEQPRPAVNDHQLIEVVAGKMDPGEVDPYDTGARELAEEVGLSAERWQLLQSSFVVSPGYTTERIHLLCCWGLCSVPSRPEDAAITGGWVGLRDALDQIDRGLISDLKTAVAILLVERRIAQGVVRLPGVVTAPSTARTRAAPEQGSGRAEPGSSSRGRPLVGP